VKVHSLTLSYTFESIRCDSRASFLVRTFTSPYLDHEPKARVVTKNPCLAHLWDITSKTTSKNNTRPPPPTRTKNTFILFSLGLEFQISNKT